MFRLFLFSVVIHLTTDPTSAIMIWMNTDNAKILVFEKTEGYYDSSYTTVDSVIIDLNNTYNHDFMIQRWRKDCLVSKAIHPRSGKRTNKKDHFTKTYIDWLIEQPGYILANHQLIEHTGELSSKKL